MITIDMVLDAVDYCVDCGICPADIAEEMKAEIMTRLEGEQE